MHVFADTHTQLSECSLLVSFYSYYYAAVSIEKLSYLQALDTKNIHINIKNIINKDTKDDFMFFDMTLFWGMYDIDYSFF